MPYKQQSKVSEEKEQQPIPKCEIFDLFYSKKQTVRAGGGTVKTKMQRIQPSLEDITKIEMRIKQGENAKFFMKYFTKLRERKAGLAPPPRPK